MQYTCCETPLQVARAHQEEDQRVSLDLREELEDLLLMSSGLLEKLGEDLLLVSLDRTEEVEVQAGSSDLLEELGTQVVYSDPVLAHPPFPL
jgi:hypothetical protein